jgi:hypothetical protein
VCAQPSDVGVDEHVYELRKVDLRPPPELLASLRRIADEAMELGTAAL